MTEHNRLRAKSARYEISEGAINMESWSDDVAVTVTNPTVFAPMEGDTVTMSLGFTADDGDENDADFPKADFSSFSTTLTPEQAKALGEELIERAENEPERIGETYEE
jgi:hypothetical protein